LYHVFNAIRLIEFEDFNDRPFNCVFSVFLLVIFLPFIHFLSFMRTFCLLFVRLLVLLFMMVVFIGRFCSYIFRHVHIYYVEWSLLNNIPLEPVVISSTLEFFEICFVKKLEPLEFVCVVDFLVIWNGDFINRLVIELNNLEERRLEDLFVSGPISCLAESSHQFVCSFDGRFYVPRPLRSFCEHSLAMIRALPPPSLEGIASFLQTDVGPVKPL